MSSLVALSVCLGILAADPQPTTAGAAATARSGATAASKHPGNASTKNVRPTPRPTFKTVQATVENFFATLPDYATGRVIVRSEAEGACKQLQRMGWPVPQSTQLLELIPDGEEELIQFLRTPEGRKFMDQIARFPLAYDRLDRWSKLKGGMREIRSTIQGPDGYRLLEYLTTTTGGKNMGQMLSKAPGGAGFNQPTGRIYTTQSLLARLKQLYDQQEPSPSSR